jgi:hypothetical protein
MKRRLLWINLALVIVLGACGYLLRQRWVEAAQRKQEILRANPAEPAKVAGKTAPVEPPPRAASYFEVAEKMLFSKDRNPTVVVDAPPPPKPMPPLPAAYGVMDIGSGPVAFLAAKGQAQRGYRAGETIGEFKLLEVSAQELAFEWDGKTIRKKVEELRGESRDAPGLAQQPAAAAPATRPGDAPPPKSPGEATTNTTNPSGDADPFGRDSGPGKKLCKPGDNTPAGTVVKGYKKVIRFSPMAQICLWEEEK